MTFDAVGMLSSAEPTKHLLRDRPSGQFRPFAGEVAIVGEDLTRQLNTALDGHATGECGVRRQASRQVSPSAPRAVLVQRFRRVTRLSVKGMLVGG